ncbi:hypothetical protein FKM82_018958 [Ascaphus truei]
MYPPVGTDSLSFSPPSQDFSQPELVLYERDGLSEGRCWRLSEALSDVEMAQYGTSTRSIHVLSGVWVAYESADFSGKQYILEKGTYHNYQDWGASNWKISSVQPVQQVSIVLPALQARAQCYLHYRREPCVTCTTGESPARALCYLYYIESRVPLREPCVTCTTGGAQCRTGRARGYLYYRREPCVICTTTQARALVLPVLQARALCYLHYRREPCAACTTGEHCVTDTVSIVFLHYSESPVQPVNGVYKNTLDGALLTQKNSDVN